MPRARYPYRGELLSLWAIEKRLKISWTTLRSWLAHGGISEQRIERHLRGRDERRRLHALAREHGIPLTAWRQRMQVGWDGEAAATAPLRVTKSSSSAQRGGV